MTDEDLVRWKKAIAMLGVAFGKGITDPLINVYWEGTKDVEIVDLEAACDKIRREDKMFPRIARIREVADGILAHRAARLALPAGDGKIPGRFCATCEDTGMVRGLTCPDANGNWCRKCSEKGQHLYDHTYTRKCACVPHNTVIKSRNEAQRGRRRYIPRDDGSRERGARRHGYQDRD